MDVEGKMTNKELVHKLRLELMRAGYPKIFAVDSETLTAATDSIIEWKKQKGLDPIVDTGRNGIWFKGCELVLKVE